MREWQQKCFKDLVMPDAVYYQTVWAVRDLARMERKLDDMEREAAIAPGAVSIVSDGRMSYRLARPTEKRAVEKAVLAMRVNAIRSALENVPPEYRQFIMDNIIKQLPYKSFPTRIWRIWKQKFLFDVAVNLEIM